MPRLFLHMRHGKTFVPDPYGTYYNYLEDARREALWAARELMRLRVQQGQPANDSAFEITNEAGRVLLVCPFHEAVEYLGEG